MRARLVVLSAVLLAGCSSGAGPVASGPCGPCQASASAGLQGVGLPRSARLDALAAKRIELARKRLAVLRISFDRGVTTLDELIGASRDVAFAAHDSGLHGQALRDLLTEYRDVVAALRDLTKERVAKGAVGEDAVDRMEGLVVEAEFWLEEAKQRL
jgi:hypothetical protein